MATTAFHGDISKKQLFNLALPTILGLVFMSMYSMVDGMFVAQLIDTTALSAINIVLPLIMVAISLGLMLAAGGSSVIARTLGEQKPQQAREIFSFITIALVIGSSILAVIGLIFLEPLLVLLGANAEILPYALDYGFWTLLLIPGAILGVFCQILFITAGKAKLGLLSTVIGGVLNIILDYIFIVYFDMGISGAALATGIGYATSAVIGVSYFTLVRSGELYFIKPIQHWRSLMETCLNGASEMVVNLSQAVITLLLNLVMIQLAGETGVAAITIILYVQALLSAAFMGYSTGVAPLISYNFGKNDEAKIKAIFTHSHHFILIASFIAFGFGLLFAEPLVALFAQRGTTVFELSVIGFRYSTFAFLWMGFNIFASAFFTALSNGKVSALIAMMRTFVFQIIAIIACAALFGATGVFWALPIAELLGLLVTYLCYRQTKQNYRFI